jgi:hypothetical protein
MVEKIYDVISLKLNINNENYKDNKKSPVNDFIELKSGGI